jgi:hypothetical protein
MFKLLLVLAFVPTAADLPRPNRHAGETTRAYDLAKLTEAEAQHLHARGEPALFLVHLNSPPWPLDNWTLYYCRGSGDDVRRSLFTQSSKPFPDRLIVRATLQVVRHATTQDGPGYTEYRLMEARQVR